MTTPMPGGKPLSALLIRLLCAAASVLPAFGAQAGVVFTTVYSFTGGEDGANPMAGLVQGSDGNFYGTTSNGGTNNSGTVFKISAAGALTSLHSFTGTNDGGWPQAGLVQGTDGNFYGTTQWGGTSNLGTVFQITSNGALTTLYSFTGASDGAYPEAALARGSDGNFYGTTYGGYGTTYGGAPNSMGSVFQITANGVLASLYSFAGAGDGASPSAGLVQGIDGNFYGVTSQAGANGFGTVFQISTNGALTTLYSFTGTSDGAYAEAGLTQGSDGNFYGTTEGGGVLLNQYPYGLGTVFQISTNGALTTLYCFPGSNFTGTNNGQYPNSALVQGSDGNFYGTTFSGGAYLDRYGFGYGTLFQISTNGGLTSLYSFTDANDGANPNGLVRGSDGNFYGTTSCIAVAGAGAVFRLAVGPAVPVFQTVALANGTLTLTWSTEVGGVYQPQFNSDLTSTNWSHLGGVLTAAGTTLSATDSVTNGPHRFYRVVLSP
jgi:uncharacterized repeat protein (TIGR03803 family)